MFSNFRKGIMVGLNWNQQINAVTRATLYNTETGGRETFPVNINGNWNLSGNASYDKRLNQFRIYVMGSGNFNQNVSLINEGYEDNMPQRSNTHTTGLNTDLRLSYLPSWGNIDLNGKWTFYQSKNSLQNRNTYTRIHWDWKLPPTCPAISFSRPMPITVSVTVQASRATMTMKYYGTSSFHGNS